MTKWARFAGVIAAGTVSAAVLELTWPRLVLGACNVIPSARTTFRGALAGSSRPFATPGDFVELTLDPDCHPDRAFPIDTEDLAVTVVFTPLGDGPRNAVVLRRRCAGFITSGEKAACETDLRGGQVTCLEADGSSLERIDERTVRFRFPDTDNLLLGPDDDVTFAGPATIAITSPPSNLPCHLAGELCSTRPGLLACVDRLFEDDGTCSRTPGRTFDHFTALPPPNAYHRLCTQPIGPCQPDSQRLLRVAVDAGGNLLVPMDWRGILVRRDAVPVPRQLRARIDVAAFPGRDVPILLPGSEVLGSFSPEGLKLPPVFDPQVDLEERGAATFFGTADAPQTVLRIARHDLVTSQCGGGPNDSLPCVLPADCPSGVCGGATCFFDGKSEIASTCLGAVDCSGGECGPGLFDFSGAQVLGVGPALLETTDVVALDPVPLDGLNQTAELNAFVLEEAIGAQDLDGDGRLDPRDLNGDGDDVDHVVKLSDRATGRVARIGSSGAEGRAVSRVKDGRFSFPALAAEGDVVAFLEPETAQGYRDGNRNGEVFESLLRAYRLTSSVAINLLAGRRLAVDADPLVNGRSLAFSLDHLVFRIREADNAPFATSLASRSSAGEPGNSDSVISSISADGRFVAFDSTASNLVADDTNASDDVFVHDRLSGETKRVSVSSAGGQASFMSLGGGDPSMSADGRFVVYMSFADDLVPDDSNESSDVFVHNLETRETRLVSLSSEGDQGNSGSYSPAISGNGRFVVFDSASANLVPGDTNQSSDVFVHDLQTGETTRVSISSVGKEGDSESLGGKSISADGRCVAFESRADNLVPGDTNVADDVFVHD